MSLLAWLVILFLILVNALYVAAEFAAVGVRRSRIHQLAQEGHAMAGGLLPILQDAHRLDHYIGACQVGITLSSLVLGAFGQATVALDFAEMFQQVWGLDSLTAHSVAAVAVLILLTTLQVVFSELVPKSLALQFPTRLALLTYLPMRWSLVLYSWFLGALNGSGLLILRALGMGQSGGHRHIHSPEEIEMLIAESRDGGLLEPEEQIRLHQALHLGRRTARQLMVPRRLVQAVNVELPPEELLELAIQSPYTRLPVYRGSIDDMIGMLHIKDVATHYATRRRAASAEELLRPLVYVPTSVTADRLLTMLRERRARLAVVLDEHGGFEGIVTLEDVLSELVGGVADEFKSGDPHPEPLPDGRIRLPGILRMDEIARLTGLPWQREGADTLSGRLLAELGTIPQGGERVEIAGVAVEIEHVEGQAIVSVLAARRPLPAPSEENVESDTAAPDHPNSVS